MNWISIESKLPEPFQPILFYSKSHGFRHGTREATVGKTKYIYFRQWSTRERYKDVTHWMSLPEPPLP